MKKLIVFAALTFLFTGAFGQWGFITREQRDDLETLKYHSVLTAATLITYADDSVAKDIVILLDSAIVWDIDIRQITNFDDGGVDSLEVGLSDNQDYFVDMIVNTGATAWDSVTFANELPYLVATDDTIRAMYWGGDSDATAGKVAICVKYSLQ